MTVDDDAKSCADHIWQYWASLNSKPKMTWIELFQICRYFHSECKKREIDWQLLDIRAELDSSLSYHENKSIVEALLKIKPSHEEEMKAYLESELARLAEGTEFAVIKQEDLDKLLAYERRVETARGQIKRLKVEKERAESEREEAVKRAAAIPALKIRIIRPFKEGVFDYKEGTVIETRNIDWAMNKIEGGYAQRVGVEVPTGPPKLPPTITPTAPVDIRERRRHLANIILAELDRRNVPGSAYTRQKRAVWELKLPDVLTQPPQVQEKLAIDYAAQIAAEYSEKREIVRRRREEEERPRPFAWQEVTGGYITPNGFFIRHEEMPAVQEKMDRMAKRLAVPPDPPYLSFKNWLMWEHGLTWGDYLKLSDPERKVLNGMYTKIVNEWESRHGEMS